MNNEITTALATAATLLMLLGATASAAELTVPNTFSAGAPARAAEVNANFNAVAAAVNTSAARLDDAAARVAALEADARAPDLAPTGNFVLGASIATAGNILKGAESFIHDFGERNTFIGLRAGNFTMAGVRNTALGTDALARDTSGVGNTAIGDLALFQNTEGRLNAATGASALFNNVTGDMNTATGTAALFSNTVGSQNTASGVSALWGNTEGSDNTANGALALNANTTGVRNTAVGGSALLSNKVGNDNIAVGMHAGTNITGSRNIAIGALGIAGENNTTRIGGPQTRTFISGIRGVTTATADAVQVVIDSAGQLGTVNSSRRVKDRIADMGAASGVLRELRPVTFYYGSDQGAEGRTLQYGLVAEEVAEVAPGLVARSADGNVETVYYQFLPPMLLNEYQNQQRTIDALAARIAELEQERRTQVLDLERHGARIAALEALLTELARGASE